MVSDLGQELRSTFTVLKSQIYVMISDLRQELRSIISGLRSQIYVSQFSCFFKLLHPFLLRPLQADLCTFLHSLRNEGG